MMKRGSREHERVKQRHRHTRVDSVCERAQHAARLRTVNVELVVNAGIARRDHHRMTVDDKTDMTNETFVQDFVDSFAIEVAAFRKTFKLGAIRYGKCHNCAPDYHGYHRTGESLCAFVSPYSLSVCSL